MNMPIRRFWLLHKNVARIAAEEQMQSLTTASAASSSDESVKEYRDQLVIAMGEVSTVVDNDRDESGVEMLKMMSGQKLGSKI